MYQISEGWGFCVSSGEIDAIQGIRICLKILRIDCFVRSDMLDMSMRADSWGDLWWEVRFLLFFSGIAVCSNAVTRDSDAGRGETNGSACCSVNKMPGCHWLQWTVPFCRSMLKRAYHQWASFENLCHAAKGTVSNVARMATTLVEDFCFRYFDIQMTKIAKRLNETEHMNQQFARVVFKLDE